MADIWIIGAGIIAQEYARILDNLGKSYVVIGRGLERTQIFQDRVGHEAIPGGVENYIAHSPASPEYAVVATDLGSLSSTCLVLMNYGVKKILCEKPGFLYPQECVQVAKTARETQSCVYLAYNRRFFSSVLKAQEIIGEDGGVTSFSFEFTEWGHVIQTLNKPEGDLENWFYANSTHVVDLAFFLGGNPVQMNAYASGELPWHKPAVFAGAGITDKGALFNYSANWAAPGRWGVELLTSRHRLYLRPMEQLRIQNIGSVAISPVEIDDAVDKEFKPGFYRETKAFLMDDDSRLCPIDEQLMHVENIYHKMMGR